MEIETSGPRNEKDAGVKGYLDAILERRWMVMATVATAVLASLVIGLVTPRVYQGSATIVVDRSGSSFGLISDVTGISQLTFVDTLAEIVRSRAVADRALERLGVPLDERDVARKRLLAGLRVQRVRGADVIRIYAHGPTPESSAAAANAIAAGFLAWHIDARRAQAAAGRQFIESQLAKVNEELRISENALARYKADGGQVALSEQTSIAVTKLAEFEAQRRTVAAEREAITASLRQARGALSQHAETIPSSLITADDPVAAGFRQELATLEVQLAGLRQQFTDVHPQVIAARARIEELKSRLRQLAATRVASRTAALNPIYQNLVTEVIKLEVDREALRARESALASAVARYADDARTLPSREVQLARLTREAKVAEQTYLLLSEKLQETRIAEASIVGDARIVDEATPPATAVRPKMKLNMLLGLLMGMILAVAIVYTLQVVDTTFKTQQEVADHLGLPILGAIPVWKQTIGVHGNGSVALATNEHRRSPFAEAFRQLRTNLLYLSPDRPLRTILVTSAEPGEGKTTVAANLAIAFSQAERKTWLIEADLRRPQIALTFQAKTAFGLSELLVDGLPLDRAVHQTTLENLWVVPSGRSAPNPAELLGSQRMQAFLSTTQEGRDVAVIDAPPILPVTDASVVAHVTDGVILVVRLGRTRRAAAKAAQRQIESVGAKVVGVVVNAVVIPHHREYDGYYSVSPTKQVSPGSVR